MILTEINEGMTLMHISDTNLDRPQKLIVVRVNEKRLEEQVFCEWISRDGKIQREWLDPLRLNKW